VLVESLLDLPLNLGDIAEEVRKVTQVRAEIPRCFLVAMELVQLIPCDGDVLGFPSGSLCLNHGYSIAEFWVKASFNFVFFSLSEPRSTHGHHRLHRSR